MKKISMLFVLMLGLMVGVSAQEVLSEGNLVLELNKVTADDPAVAQQMEMMKGAELKVTFKDGNSLAQMDMMGGMVKSTSVTMEDGSGKLLMDMMGNKMYIPFTSEDATKNKEATAEMWESLDIVYDKSDTKEIQGIKCYKMTVQPKEESENGGLELSGYVTESIDAKANIMGIDVSNFDGFPLEISIGGSSGQMTFSTIKLDKSGVDAGVFELNTGGYKEMTMDEFMEMMSSMGGGGFGF